MEFAMPSLPSLFKTTFPRQLRQIREIAGLVHQHVRDRRLFRRDLFAVLELRERLIFKLAVLAGLRPGEIFGLRRSRLSENSADIQERVYRGKLDTPKTQKSLRVVPLSASVRHDLQNWLGLSAGGPEGWLFPSETLETPLSRDNALYR